MNQLEREALISRHLSDPSSSYYQRMNQMLRAADAAERRARVSQPYVTIPFYLDVQDTAFLNAQFGQPIKIRGVRLRCRATNLCAGIFFMVEKTLIDHVSGKGATVLVVDGDVSTAVAVGLDGKIIERTYATPRLVADYAMDDALVETTCGVGGKGKMNVNALCMRREMKAGGDHYWASVRSDGPKVDAIVVNHFKTPVGPRQLAYLATLRQASVYGAFPFQPDMLILDEGELECFPGRYYVDRGTDTITLVPESDATMSISHPYSLLMSLAQNNTVVADGVEYLCEKYFSVKGIYFYSLKRVEGDFAATEELVSSFPCARNFDVTEISFPEAKMSAEGVPIGMKRGIVRMMTSRLEIVLARVMTIEKAVVTPNDVFVALADNNALVLNSLDTVKKAVHMPVDDEMRAALAIALHVNWVRHSAKATLKTLLTAVKLRFGVPAMTVPGFAIAALSAWWSAPRVAECKEDGIIPGSEVVDWCGNDFAVVMREEKAHLDVVQIAGLGRETEEKVCSYFPAPKPRLSESRFASILAKAKAHLAGASKRRESSRSEDSSSGGSSSGSESGRSSAQRVVSTAYRMKYPGGSFSSKASSTTAVTTVSGLKPTRFSGVVLTDKKRELLRKMVHEQSAVDEIVPMSEVLGYDEGQPEQLVHVDVPDVDVVSSIADDWNMIQKTDTGRRVHRTGYAIAETEVNLVREGQFSVNDNRRVIPKAKYIMLPKVDMGVEGVRVASAASLLGAMQKRNIGVPAHRGTVNIAKEPVSAVERVIKVCMREDWKEIVNRHLERGMWEPNVSDIEDYISNLEEKKVDKMLDEFFMESNVNLENWLLMAKGKVKPSAKPGAGETVAHSQTIMYQESSNTNGMYSAMTRRFVDCLKECLRPEIMLNCDLAKEDHERWYNSLNGRRDNFLQTFSYACDISTYDRSQEHMALRIDLEFYKRFGLSKERLKIWERVHGPKKAKSLLFGITMRVVLSGVSGIWDTLLRNGLVNLAVVVVAAELKPGDVVAMDIKGDDLDLELSRQIDVQRAVSRMSLGFNLSAKLFTADVRYMCKDFRVKHNGRWYFVADPVARALSLCTPVAAGNHETSLSERWISLKADLLHYENGTLIDLAAEAAMVYYDLDRPPYAMARALSNVVRDRKAYYGFFRPMEMVE